MSAAAAAAGGSLAGAPPALAAILHREPNTFPLKTLDPFLFAVYHHDLFPVGDAAHMRAPMRGNGSDFELTKSKPYRMYHGDQHPGFPAHPHRGIETITVTLEGLVDHADSMGASGRYGQGDQQWMSAGSGVQHQEMFPLIKTRAPNTLKLFQIWLNLARKDKMCAPCYKMHWAERVQAEPGEGGARALCYVGSLGGAQGAAPPPSSWAADPAHAVGVYIIQLPPGGAYTLPPAAGAPAGAALHRMAYVTQGAVEGVEARLSTLTLDPALPLPLRNAGAEAAEVLVLQGVAIGEPVVQHGPFVVRLLRLTPALLPCLAPRAS